MTADVHQDDGVLGGNGIKVISVRVSLLFDSGVVVAPPKNPLAGLRLLLIEALAQLPLNARDGFHVTDRIWVEIDDGELERLLDDVGMRAGVKEPVAA